MNGNEVAWLCQGCGKGNRKNRPANASTSQTLEKYVLAIPGAYKNSQGNPPSLIIEYATPVAAASGFLVDVDQNEIWTAIPLNAAGKPLTAAQGCTDWAVHAPPRPKDGWNGQAKQFDVSCDDQEIYAVKIEGDKKINIIGFAFDRFSPASKICSCP